MNASRQSGQREGVAPKSAPQPARILAVDYGRERIGLAVADEQVGLPRPLATLARKNRNEDMKRLREIVREHAVKQIVVGLPLRMDGTRGEMAKEAEHFAERLRKQLGLPVELVDERLTSWEAEQIRQQASTTHGKTSQPVDAVAAAVILREYLERGHAAKEQG